MNKKQLGNLVMTQGVNSLMSEFNNFSLVLRKLVNRHMNKDFGASSDIGKDSIKENLKSIAADYGTVLSVYKYQNITIWIMTYLNDYTCILLPEEY